MTASAGLTGSQESRGSRWGVCRPPGLPLLAGKRTHGVLHMMVRRHEKYVEELAVQLGFKESITASGAVMTLPAAVADLIDWVGDRRKYLTVQFGDWLQVVDDYQESLRATGPKLRSFVESLTAPIELLLQSLIEYETETIDPIARADLAGHLALLKAALTTPEATVEAWRDLVRSAENDGRSFEEVTHRRDILWAIVYRRNLDLGHFGVLRQARDVLIDDDDAVSRELATERGTKHKFKFPPRSRSIPTGQPLWRRLELCEAVLSRDAPRGDCIVWLRLAPTLLPQWEVRHGPVTFYNAHWLSGWATYPSGAGERMKYPPWEVLKPKGDPPILRDGEVEWENDNNMVYARVELPGIPPHAAEAKARALVESFVVVNHAAKDTWRLLNGSLLFVDGKRRSLMSWGAKEDFPMPFNPYNDWMGRDIGKMASGNRTLDGRSLANLQEAIGMSTTLKLAVDESPQATVMAAVRAIEHVNAWTTGGVKDWAEFASSYFKKASSRIRFVQFMNHLNLFAMDGRPNCDYGSPPSKGERELWEIRSKMRIHVWPHEMINSRGLADHVSDFARIYDDAHHWISRGLREVESSLATPAAMHAALEEHCRRFDRQLRRLKRLRNAAIHGGPVSDTACQSVANFASTLAHVCLNEAIRAVLTGADIETHIKAYRDDHIDRFRRIKEFGDIDALFVPTEFDIEAEDREGP